jgi:hypothetical protein
MDIAHLSVTFHGYNLLLPVVNWLPMSLWPPLVRTNQPTESRLCISKLCLFYKHCVKPSWTEDRAGSRNQPFNICNI